jgi:hypothetical protein
MGRTKGEDVFHIIDSFFSEHNLDWKSCDRVHTWESEIIIEDSSFLTTFWTPNCRYRWTRLPFGVKPAAEEYQRRQHDALQGLPGISIIADDILVYGCGALMEDVAQDHDHNLTQLLQREGRLI